MNRTRTTRQAAVTAAVLALTLALAGCGEDDSDSAAPDSGPSRSATAQEPESEAPEEAESPAAPKEVEVTPPGTRLKIGERAVVPYDRAGTTGALGITVTAVEKLDRAAFDAAMGDKANPDITPYCVRYTVDNADGSDLGRTYPPRLTGVTASGGRTGAVLIGVRGVTGCEEATAPDDFAEAGADYRTTRVQGAGPGATVAGASYAEDDYRDEPLVWTP